MKRYTKILGLGLGVLNSGTVLLLATLYPGTSPPFMLILGGGSAIHRDSVLSWLV